MNTDSKHTPGPWIICAGANPKNKTIIAGSTESHAVICSTSGDGWSEADHLSISTANAHLIALEALKAVDRFFSKSVFDNGTIHQTVKDAITKSQPK